MTTINEVTVLMRLLFILIDHCLMTSSVVLKVLSFDSHQVAAIQNNNRAHSLYTT